jgi:hypothetical protein
MCVIGGTLKSQRPNWKEQPEQLTVLHYDDNQADQIELAYF